MRETAVRGPAAKGRARAGAGIEARLGIETHGNRRLIGPIPSGGETVPNP